MSRWADAGITESEFYSVEGQYKVWAFEAGLDASLQSTRDAYYADLDDEEDFSL